MFEGRATIGHDHGYDEKFYLKLALDSAYVEGFVEGYLERIDDNATPTSYIPPLRLVLLCP